MASEPGGGRESEAAEQLLTERTVSEGARSRGERIVNRAYDRRVVRHCERMSPAELAAAEQFLRQAYQDAGDAENGVAHALHTAQLLSEIGCATPVVIAGMLHDVVEDTSVTVDEIHQQFGPETAAVVAALTEDPAIADYRERKRALRESIRASGRTAMVIFAAEKVARLGAALIAGDQLTREQLEHYRRSLEMLIAGGVRTEHVSEFAALLRNFAPTRHLPPGPALPP